MSIKYMHRTGEKRKSLDDYDYEERNSEVNMSPSSKSGHHMETEKRLRREIANSNERRRMQSINAGFESLKALIPHHREEKLSKAAILQQTSEYISNLESEKSRLLSQNCILRQALKDLHHNPDALVGFLSDQITLPPPTNATNGTRKNNNAPGNSGSFGSLHNQHQHHGPSACKRKKRDTESSDEGISMGFDGSEQGHVDELRREVMDLKLQLERERRLRQMMEENNNKPAVSPAPPVSPHTATTNTSAPQASPTHSTGETVDVKNILPSQQTQAEEKKVIHAEPVQTKFEVTPPGYNRSGAPSLPAPPRVPVFNSSMSKRNLETIVEAIRHLEGDHILREFQNNDRIRECNRALKERSLCKNENTSSSDEDTMSLSQTESVISLSSSANISDADEGSNDNSAQHAAHIQASPSLITIIPTVLVEGDNKPTSNSSPPQVVASPTISSPDWSQSNTNIYSSATITTKATLISNNNNAVVIPTQAKSAL